MIWAPVALVAVAVVTTWAPLAAAGFTFSLGAGAPSMAQAATAACAGHAWAASTTPAPLGASVPYDDTLADGEGDAIPPAAAPGRSPAVARAAWLTASTAVLFDPGSDATIDIVLGEDFPITVEADQVEGSGWLLVKPHTIGFERQGYVPTAAVTYQPPAAGSTSSAGIEALSPELADYLAGWGTQVGLTVTDLAAGITYSYNGDQPFTTASSVKVALMFALLRQLEVADRSPSEEQLQLLTAMIEWSDNDAAEAIDLMVGDCEGLQAFADELGLGGFSPGSTYVEGWGWGTLTPDAMVRLLTLFERGSVLASSADQALARQLLSSIDSDQRIGVGTTAPDGAFVMMKNGWVPGPDDLWVFNSSGIVELNGHAYIISAYTAHNASLEQGQEIVVHATAAVAALLG